MKSYSLYYFDDSEHSNWEAESKGYRNDVFVKFQDEVFRLHVYDHVRLIQDFEEEIKQYGYYQIEPNLILVQTVNEKEIIKTINNLIRTDYFQKIKPMEKEEIGTKNLIKITK
ncbi:hypothetical protein E0485_05805 [Paenibacillus albiflavus]|uniref:Uncharacterized protein n=1 Tax=Paenibacillus albiflavus TaxID=2545760 RepID=A0A4R4ELY5_9BACL|nr:hypothetical protein [Paenibacillus albiflavus]TCZ79375.1 hypothetical protein E0485_05805 [Paenibacillus albiflavus]